MPRKTPYEDEGVPVRIYLKRKHLLRLNEMFYDPAIGKPLYGAFSTLFNELCAEFFRNPDIIKFRIDEITR